jgi:peptidoglycan L-alanyl-D-glutamate endopeptidase CwlK
VKHHKWGDSSLKQLSTCHPDLVKLFNEVLILSPLDLKIIEGHRTSERQAELLEQNKTTVAVSKHNSSPSLAIDVAPLVGGKIEWGNRELWLQFSAFVRGVAAAHNIKIRSGADWDNDWNAREHNFFDAPHFELITNYSISYIV